MLESNGFKRILLLASVLVTYSSGAAAQQVVNQVLEEVIVATNTTALLADFEDTQLLPLEVYPDPVDINPDSGDIRACKKTGRGLFCLAGNEIRRWSDLTGLSSEEKKGEFVLNCRHPDLNLDDRKPNTCTTMTMNAAGTEGWLGGKEKGKAYSLINFVKKQSGACPADDSDGTWMEFDPANGFLDPDYCWRMLESGRPLLVKLVRLDETDELILLEERKTILSRIDGESPDPIASSKSELGLAGNEQVLSIDVVEWEDAPYVLYTTTKDGVRAVNKTGTPSSFPVFDFVTNRISIPAPCDTTSEQQYDITAGTDGGLVFATDRNFCLVMALGLEDDPSNPNPFRLTATATLSTDPALPPSYVTSGPGISINLGNCAGNAGCDLIKGAATLTNVQLVTNSPTGMTLYQIKGIPDCRYIPQDCINLGLDLAEVIIDLGPVGDADPAAQLLNLTPLLPDEITDALEEGDVLPDMLMSRRWRGQKENDFMFEAFFGRTEEDVVFRNTFNGTFEVELLAGSELGCEFHEDETEVETILQKWDTVTTVSERYVTFADPDIEALSLDPDVDTLYRDTLTNVDCGFSSKTIDGRWSLKPYNTEITPCTWNSGSAAWDSDGSCELSGSETADDAVFAKLLLSLYDDLGDAIDELGCMDVDGNSGTAPLSASVCGTAQAQWANGLQKLQRCWDATQQPKESSANQNCQSFVSQLTGLTSTLAGATSSGTDRANRVGELQARIAVITHVYFDRFVPSIPANGFCEPGNPLHMDLEDQDCTQ